MFPLVQVLLCQNDPHLCLFRYSFLIFIRMFDKTDIQWSSDVGHTNLHKKMISKNCKKRSFIGKIKTELHHDGVGLLLLIL